MEAWSFFLNALTYCIAEKYDHFEREHDPRAIRETPKPADFDVTIPAVTGRAAPRALFYFRAL